MKNVTESIFDGKYTVIPMADVSHIKKEFIVNLTNHAERKGYKVGDLESAYVITKHTTYNSEQDEYNNHIHLYLDEAKNFLKAWCQYRHELEQDTLKDLTVKN